MTDHFPTRVRSPFSLFISLFTITAAMLLQTTLAHAQTIDWGGAPGNQFWSTLGAGGWTTSIPDTPGETGRVTSPTDLRIGAVTPSYSIAGFQLLHPQSNLSITDGRSLTINSTTSQIVSGADLYIGIAPPWGVSASTGSLLGNSSPSALQNQGTIRGRGEIAAGFTNTGAGQILADQSGFALQITGGTKTNSSGGDMVAIGGGILSISASSIANNGGTLIASTASRVDYATVINGGTIQGTGIHRTVGSSAFNSVTFSSGSNLEINATTTFGGISSLTTTDVSILSQLNNTGTTTISNTVFQGTGALANSNVLQGNGAIMSSNFSNSGTVTATGNLILDPVGASYVNTGLWRANGSGTLQLLSGSFNNSSGQISADGASGVVSYNGSTVSGGDLTGSGTHRVLGTSSFNSVDINANRFHVTNGSIANVNGGSLDSPNVIVDGLLNTGSLAVTGPQRLSGTGTVNSTQLSVSAGGAVAPGQSTGSLTVSSMLWNGGGVYEFEINDAAGFAGSSTSGWDLLAANNSLIIGATQLNPMTIELHSLDSLQLSGFADNFDPNQSYAFAIATAAGGVFGFDANKFVVDASQFLNAHNGNWSVGLSGNQVLLRYASIPEPGCAVLLCGLGVIATAVRRQRAAVASGRRATPLI